MERVRERAVAKGIVREEDWPKFVQHGCTQFVEVILRMIDLYESKPDIFTSERSTEEEAAEWTGRLTQIGDSLELEEVDRVEPDKNFMPHPELHLNIPKVLLPVLNRIISDEDYRLPPAGLTPY